MLFYFSERVMSLKTNGLTQYLSNHRSGILIGIGIGMNIVAFIKIAKDTPKAIKLIEQKKEEEKVEVLTKIDTVKTIAKIYIPSISLFTCSIACIIAGYSDSVKKYAALSAAYKLSETAFSEYRESVIDTVGEKKERLVKDRQAERQLESVSNRNNEVFVTEKGNTLCFDQLSSRFFKSDIDLIKKAVNNLNSQMINENYISLNDFYDEIGLPHTTIGEQIGWCVYKTGIIDIYFSSQIHEDQPCIVVEYSNPPIHDFMKF